MAKFLIGRELSIRSESVIYPIQDRARSTKRLWTCQLALTDEETERVNFFNALSQEYAAPPSRMSHGFIVGKLVRLTKMRGKYYRFMGLMVDGEAHLHPIEAVYLAESNKLQIWDNGLPASIQQLYNQLFDPETFSHYLVYVRLSRFGFTLRIRSLFDKLTDYVKPKIFRYELLPDCIPIDMCHLPFIHSRNCDINPVDTVNSRADSTTIRTLLDSLSPYPSTFELMTSLQQVVQVEKNQQSGDFKCENFVFDAYGHTGSEKERMVNFSKRLPLPPDFLVSVSSPEHSYPSLSENDFLTVKVSSATEVVHCIVDGTDIFFHSVKAFRIPILQPEYKSHLS